MRRNKAGIILTSVLCFFIIAGLGCSAVSPSAPVQKRRVALVAKSTQTEFWKSVFAGAEAAAAEYNLELVISGPETEEDYEAQNQLVRQAVAGGAEALVFSAIDFENNAATIDAAAAAGVKIVTIDSRVTSQYVETYIGTDNYAAGQQAASAALESGYEHMYVGLINYDVNSANGQEREKGARDRLLAAKDVTLVDTINVLAAADNAMAGTMSMLHDHPEINVLIAFNEPTAVGAARAVDSLKLYSSIWLVGFDSNVETVDKLQTGAVDALIVQNPYAMGYLGVESAYKLISGKSGTLEPIVDTSTLTVTLSNMFTVDGQKALFPFQ